MARDTCRMPSCDNEPMSDPEVAIRTGFCSQQCEVKFDHLEDDALDARLEIEHEAQLDEQRERYFDKNGHF